MQRHQTASWEQNDVQNFVCAQLLALIESQATRKFVAHTRDPDTVETALLVCLPSLCCNQSDPKFQLWVFNPDLMYSASYLSNGGPRRAMKVLFQDLEDPESTLQSNSNVEELVLPAEVIRQITSDLATSNGILPASAKKFQEWRVALLDRFDPSGE